MSGDSKPKDVQIFDAWSTAENREVKGRLDMATGDLSYIALFQTAPRRGELAVHQHPDSDQILFILDGECAVTGLEGSEVVEGQEMLNTQEGILIPAGSYYGFSNFGDKDMFFLSMRTESTGGRRIQYVPETPSGVKVNLPFDSLPAEFDPKDVSAYIMDHKTIGISSGLVQEWNRACLLRGSCSVEETEDGLQVELPKRLTDWYEIEELADDAYEVQSVPDKRAVNVQLV